MTEIEKHAGRVLLAGFEQSAFDDDLASLLAGVRPGGVIFFKRNITGATEFAELVEQVTKALSEPGTTPAFPVLALDMEGGTVDRLRHVLAPFPSARSVAATGDDPFMRQFGALVGESMAAFGLNLDFAPVLDLATAESEPVMGTRSVSADPPEVVRFARNFLDGLGRHNVLGCGKHFPGLGSGARDTHLEMAPVEKTAEQLWEQDMAPFRELHSDLLLIMVSHAWYPALHPEGATPRPASLSREIVTGLLRERIGFKGVVVADDLEMGGALAGRTIAEAAVAAIEAGCDLLPVCRVADNIRAAHRALIERANADAGFADRLQEASGRVEVLQQSLRHMAEDQQRATKPDWKRLAEAIRHLAEGTEHMGTLAAERPRYSNAAARPRKPERGAGGRGGGGGGRGRERGGGRGRPERERSGGRREGARPGRGRPEGGPHRERDHRRPRPPSHPERPESH